MYRSLTVFLAAVAAAGSGAQAADRSTEPAKTTLVGYDLFGSRTTHADQTANADAWTRVAQLFERKIPGETEAVEPVQVDPNSVPPPEPNLPGESVPVPDRWRIVDAIGVHSNPFDPYNHNTLKGDRPIFDDWFVNLSAISDTIAEPRAFPIPTGFTGSKEPVLGTFGKMNTFLFAETAIFSISFIKGDTAFKPPDYEIRFVPVVNYNFAQAEEREILRKDPAQGFSRVDSFAGLQEAFVDYHIRNVSDRYDFDSIRIGIQPFQADFRGFLFQDQQLGVRLFGNRDNNHFQYNLAYFRRIEKDTNSGLNDITKPLRRDNVYIANLYAQDFPVFGFTSQATVVHNDNHDGYEGYEDDPFGFGVTTGKPYFDNNGFLIRPSPLGDQRQHSYRVTYFGLNGDGHFGRLNLTYSAYYAYGKDSHNVFTQRAPDESSRSTISAWFFAAEPSYDLDWVRLRGSFLYASGDRDATDGRETGFDAILENPQFAGADSSFWIRQAVPLIGGSGVGLSGRNGILPSLRSSKDEGQSNFINPGLWLYGVGADIDVLPELRVSVNANDLWFDNTDSLTRATQAGTTIPRHIGYDLSTAITYRPLFTQNIVFRLSGAALVPTDGFKRLFDEDSSPGVFYSVLANLVLTY
jgi:hypothetical protein